MGYHTCPYCGAPWECHINSSLNPGICGSIASPCKPCRETHDYD